jgi:hypothetical protein
MTTAPPATSRHDWYAFVFESFKRDDVKYLGMRSGYGPLHGFQVKCQPFETLHPFSGAITHRKWTYWCDLDEFGFPVRQPEIEQALQNARRQFGPTVRVPDAELAAARERFQAMFVAPPFSYETRQVLLETDLAMDPDLLPTGVRYSELAAIRPPDPPAASDASCFWYEGRANPDADTKDPAAPAAAGDSAYSWSFTLLPPIESRWE